jgi:hypothetical protein
VLVGSSVQPKYKLGGPPPLVSSSYQTSSVCWAGAGCPQCAAPPVGLSKPAPPDGMCARHVEGFR